MHSRVAIIIIPCAQDRAATDVYQDANYSVKWSVDNEMDLVVAAVYQRVLALSYVDDLLVRCRDAFVSLLRNVAPEARDVPLPPKAFAGTLAALQSELEQRTLEERKAKTAKVPRAFNESKKFANTRAGNKASCAVGGGDKPSAAAVDLDQGAEASGAAADDEPAAAGASGDDKLSKDEQIAANIAKMLRT